MMGIEFNNQQIYALYDMEKWYYKGDEQVYELSGAAGTGKAQPHDTIIPTPDGDIEFGDLKIGDYVLNRHYQPVKVVGIYEQGYMLSYEVRFESGRSTECSIQHLWTYVTNINQNKMETTELSKLIVLMDMGHHIYVPEASTSNRVTYDRITMIRSTGIKKKMRCILVDDKEHLYLTNDHIVTHNTTLVKYFIERIGLDIEDVAFVAFMGKAAMQLSRTGLPAQTLHSLIYDCKKEWKRDEDGELVLNSVGRPVFQIKFEVKEFLPKNLKLIVLDEGYMVDSKMAQDLLSFGIPVVVLGDLNQLPPVFGKPFFLNDPDCILTQVMRQSEGSPIVYLAHRILNNEPLRVGVYGNSAVIPKADLDLFAMKDADIVLTCTNALRHNINTFFRQEIYKFAKLDWPYEGEKVICRRNNWSKSLDGIIYLTNGIAGTIDFVDKESFNGKEFKMDFKPDFTKKRFKNLKVDYQHLLHPVINEEDKKTSWDLKNEQFEFAYAITTHLSQGSQYPNVYFLREDKMSWNAEVFKKLQYTAITRAMEKITIAI